MSNLCARSSRFFARLSLLPILIAGVVLVGASGCEGEPQPDPQVLAFAELGNRPVGYTTTTIAYANALDGQTRELPLHVWYPALEDGDFKATYRALGVIALGSDVAVENAAVATGAFPLVVYSHGSGGDGVLAFEYGEQMASHGYVVVAPTHVGNTTGNRLFGGAQPLVNMLAQRPLDIRGTLDAIERSEHAVLRAASTDEVVLFGHSFGAYTALAIAGVQISADQLDFLCDDEGDDCSIRSDPRYLAQLERGWKDRRVVAFGAQAPAFVEAMVEESFSRVEIPMLLMSGRQDVTTTHEEQAIPIWEGLHHREDVWLDFVNAGHQSFVTTCRDLATWQQDLLLYRPQEDGCGPDQTNAMTVVYYTAAAMRRWSDAYLRDDDALLSEVKTAQGADGVVEVSTRGDID